ncbi:50S ribosomal protein L17 [bacterium]|nr:50S ribosomal protein L17 [bacterium]
MNQSKLGKPTDARVAMVRNQVAALFEHGAINTTLPRAKAVRSLAEKLITRAKRGDLTAIRTVASNLPGGKTPLRALLRNVVPGLASVSSGYTTITKLYYRRGDGALVVRLAINGYTAPAA